MELWMWVDNLEWHLAVNVFGVGAADSDPK